MSTMQTLTTTEIDHVSGGITLSFGGSISTDAVVTGLYGVGTTLYSSGAAVAGALADAGVATYNAVSDVTAALGTSVTVTGGIS
jgi:hypothetical protein